MYSHLAFPRFVVALALVLIAGLNALPARAQSSSPSQGPTAEQHEHPAATSAQEHEGHDMQMARDASGTAWLPDTTPMYAIHRQRGPWQFMVHENAFVQFLDDSGNRGHDQFGSINWMMGMAQRNLGRGRVIFRGMFSAEPSTIRGCGYPERPVAMMMAHSDTGAQTSPANITTPSARPTGGAQEPAGQKMVMVQTAYDPAKLSCSPKIDPKDAAKTTYQGKTYYFCSVRERDDFLTDPAMSLSMMPPKQ